MKLLFLLFVASTLGACAAEARDESPASEEKVDERNVDLETDTTTPSYGSGWASNCYCTFCSQYCTVDGRTYKNGTCC